MSDGALTRPTAKVEKDFLFSSGKLSLECNLEKDVFYHGQEIPVNLFINNNGNNQGIKLKGIYNKTVVVQGLLTNLYHRSSTDTIVAIMCRNDEFSSRMS